MSGDRIMILRIADIPELKEFSENHRRRIIGRVEQMVCWKPQSLLLWALLCFAEFGVIQAADWTSRLFKLHWGVTGLIVAFSMFAAFSAHRFVGINTFFRPAIQSLIASGLSSETDRRCPSQREYLLAAVLATAVVIIVCRMA
jgi:hypothetical protein